MYSPDRWSLLKYRDGSLAVLAGWNGAYVEPDEWRRSSPIIGVRGDSELLTESGSCYKVDWDRYGLTEVSHSVWASMEFQMKMDSVKAVTLLTEKEARKELKERFQ